MSEKYYYKVINKKGKIWTGWTKVDKKDFKKSLRKGFRIVEFIEEKIDKLKQKIEVKEK